MAQSFVLWINDDSVESRDILTHLPCLLFVRWGLSAAQVLLFLMFMKHAAKEHLAREVMSRELVTVSISVSLREAWDLMGRERIRHLPAVDPAGQIVGILSDRDIQRAMKPKKKSETGLVDLQFEFDPEFTVRDFMSYPVHQVREDVLIRDAAWRMLHEKISALLVTGMGGGVIGIMTTDDLLKLLVSILSKEGSWPLLSLGTIFREGYLREDALN